MNKILYLLLAAAFFLTACDNNRQEKSAETKPLVKIGVSLPLTGNLAPIGNSVKQALLMAQKEISPDSKYDYAIIFADDGYELRNIANNTNRHLSIEKVDALLSLFDGAAGVIAPIAEKAEVPNIGCTWGADFFKKYNYSFNHWSRPETQSKAFIDLLKAKNTKSFAVIMLNYASTLEMMEQVKKDAARNHIKITSVNVVNNGTRDFRLIIEKIKQQHPDVVMIQMLDPELSIFSKQAFEAGLHTPFVAIDQLQTAQNKKLLQGAEFVLSLDGSQDFKNRLAKQTDLPAYPCAANLYDAFNLLVDVFENSPEKPSGRQIKDKIYQVKDFPSSLGVKLNVDEDGIIDSPLQRAKIIDGDIVFNN